MRYADLHMHSKFSSDGKGDLFDMCEAALAQGLSGVAFTEHWDALPREHAALPYETDSEYYYRHEADALCAVREAKERYRGRLALTYAVELGQPNVDPETCRDFLAARGFDFVLGSVHVVESGIDYYYVDYDHADIPALFRDYYERNVRLLSFDGIDSLGHLDYPIRKMQKVLEKPVVMTAYRDCIAEVLRAAVQKGVALEINTNGLRNWFDRFSPEPWVAELYRDLGGTYVTTGSDAHNIEHVGFGIRETADWAASVGLKVVCEFRQHEPIFAE